MGKVSEEEFEKLVAEKRHDDLITALRELTEKVGKGDDTAVLSAIQDGIQMIEKLAPRETEIQPLVDAINAGMKELQKRPRFYEVVRDKEGFINKFVPVY